MRRARAGLKDPRPIGSFLFLGPTASARPSSRKALAEFLFEDRGRVITLDMSEFMEHHTVARLVGAPPGYVGNDAGGRSPRPSDAGLQVVLLDEIEKAHPEVFNILLQVLDEGRLTEPRAIIDFANTVVVMTSNLGAKQLQTNSSLGFRPVADDEAGLVLEESVIELMKDKVTAELKNSFVERPKPHRRDGRVPQPDGGGDPRHRGPRPRSTFRSARTSGRWIHAFSGLTPWACTSRSASREAPGSTGSASRSRVRSRRSPSTGLKSSMR